MPQSALTAKGNPAGVCVYGLGDKLCVTPEHIFEFAYYEDLPTKLTATKLTAARLTFSEGHFADGTSRPNNSEDSE